MLSKIDFNLIEETKMNINNSSFALGMRVEYFSKFLIIDLLVDFFVVLVIPIVIKSIIVSNPPIP